MIDRIEHEGTVLEHSNSAVKVVITSMSACSACHAKAACSISEQKEKIIDVWGFYDVSVGDKVVVEMKKDLGLSAVFFGYIAPLLVVFVSLCVFVSLDIHEALSGLIAVLLLVPYYLILRLFRPLLNKKFTFTIKV